MNFNKLSKYFSGKLPNSEKMNISEFVKVLGNLEIDGDFISEYGAKFGSIKTDYDNLFKEIYNSDNGESKIYNILKYFELSKSFLEMIDYSKEIVFESEEKNDLSEIKKLFLGEYSDILKDLEDSKNNKYNGNEYENLVEKFLLNSSYFNKGFSKEFRFEIGGQKIDRLLKLKKDIMNNNHHLGYVAIEVKYKTDKKDSLSVNEIPQFESYINILNKQNICKYGILVCSNNIKQNAIDKLKSILENCNSKENPFYIALITGKEIKEFLENKGNYENMSFDEFIERSFIKWLK